MPVVRPRFELDSDSPADEFSIGRAAATVYPDDSVSLSGSAVFPVLCYMRLPRGSFEMLARSHFRELCACAFGLCGDSHTAEALVQECLLRVWCHLRSLRDQQALRAWLYATVRRVHARLYQRPCPDTGTLDDLKLAGLPVYDTSTEP